MLGDLLYKTKILQWNYVPSSTPRKIHLVLQLNAKQRLEKKIEKKSENTKSYWVRGLRVLQYMGQPTLRLFPSYTVQRRRQGRAVAHIHASMAADVAVSIIRRHP